MSQEESIQSNDKLGKEQPDASGSQQSLSTAIGAIGGAVAGAALGKAVAGRFGTVVGGIAGAIAGSQVAEPVTHFAEEVSESLGLGIGADAKLIELPPHYSWEELQALSRPQ